MKNETNLIVLTDYIIEKYHNPLKEDLSNIELFLDKIIEVHGYKHPEFEKIKKIFKNFKSEMINHLYKEEEILFPMMRKIQKSFDENIKLGDFHCGSIKNPINQMEIEHGIFDENLEKIKEFSNNFFIPQDACKTYINTYKLLNKVYNDTLEHASFEE